MLRGNLYFLIDGWSSKYFARHSKKRIGIIYFDLSFEKGEY